MCHGSLPGGESRRFVCLYTCFGPHAQAEPNKCTHVMDLMGLEYDDLQIGQGADANQKSWIRRCINAANSK